MSRGFASNYRIVLVATGLFACFAGLGVRLVNLHVVERFSQTGPNTLKYEMTINDPGTWTRPWSLMIPLSRADHPMYEYGCHEGNYAMHNLLSGSRAEEKRRADAAARGEKIPEYQEPARGRGAGRGGAGGGGRGGREN